MANGSLHWTIAAITVATQKPAVPRKATRNQELIAKTSHRLHGGDAVLRRKSRQRLHDKGGESEKHARDCAAAKRGQECQGIVQAARRDHGLSATIAQSWVSFRPGVLLRKIEPLRGLWRHRFHVEDFPHVAIWILKSMGVHEAIILRVAIGAASGGNRLANEFVHGRPAFA